MSEIRYIVEGTVANDVGNMRIKAGTTVYLSGPFNKQSLRCIWDDTDANITLLENDIEAIDLALKSRDPWYFLPSERSIKVVAVDYYPDIGTWSIRKEAPKIATVSEVNPVTALVLPKTVPDGPFSVTITGPDGNVWWQVEMTNGYGAPNPDKPALLTGGPEEMQLNRIAVNLLTAALRVFAGMI